MNSTTSTATTITEDDFYHSPHSYVVKNRDGSFDARCYRTCKDPNRIGYIVCETTHRSVKAAIASAKRFHKEFGGTIVLPSP